VRVLTRVNSLQRQFVVAAVPANIVRDFVKIYRVNQIFLGIGDGIA
jgi:hypothetical protein